MEKRGNKGTLLRSLTYAVRIFFVKLLHKQACSGVRRFFSAVATEKCPSSPQKTHRQGRQYEIFSSVRFQYLR